MFRLIKLLISLVGLAAFIWFGANVPLGTRTLFAHLQAIGQTREAQDLVKGTKESARPLVEEAGRRLANRSESTDGDKRDGKTDDAKAGEAKPEAKQADKSDGKLADAKGGTTGVTSPPARPPAERVSDGDKQALRRVLGNASAPKPNHAIR